MPLTILHHPTEPLSEDQELLLDEEDHNLYQFTLERPYMLYYVDMIETEVDGKSTYNAKLIMLGAYDTYENAMKVQQYLNVAEYVEFQKLLSKEPEEEEELVEKRPTSVVQHPV